jgi:hypothetical protein
MLRKFLTALATAALTAGLLTFGVVGSAAASTGGTFDWTGNGWPNPSCKGIEPGGSDTMLWIFTGKGDGGDLTNVVLHWDNGETVEMETMGNGGGSFHAFTPFFDPTDSANQPIYVTFDGTLAGNATLTISGCNEAGGPSTEVATVTTTVHLGATDSGTPVVVDQSNPADFGSTVHDSAHLEWTGTGNLPDNSTVVFYFFDNGTCANDPIDQSDPIAVSGGSPVNLDPELAEGPLGSGDYSYLAFFFSGDTAVVADDSGDCEPLAVSAQAQGLPITVTKDAAGGYKTKYAWTIDKSVDKTRVEQIGGTATFNYTVEVSHDAGTNQNYAVKGKIYVTNPNAVSVDILGITDTLSDTTTCTVTNGGAQTLASGETDFDYSCSLSGAPSGDLTNSVEVTWADQNLSDNSHLDAGKADFTTPDVISFSQTDTIDECIDVTDTYAGDLGNVCVGDANPTDLKYSRTVNVPAHDCVNYDNTATFTTNDTSTTGHDDQRVTVCGPAATGALTMGFWQNKNGQSIITKYCGGTSGTSLHAYLTSFHPFSDETATTCAGEATYVYNIIKAATCTSSSKTCNSMLKAQMLATALDVYFSTSSLGGVKISAPNGSIGAIQIDLTKVCAMIDGSGGNATCSGSYTNVSAQFGGQTCLTVSQMLAYQNTSDPAADAGAVWYSQVKASQVNAKNAFDAINNQVAFSC